jgi:hypothetical protein
MFIWSDREHLLLIEWPKGAQQPEVLGAFEGAKSPLDPKEPD